MRRPGTFCQRGKLSCSRNATAARPPLIKQSQSRWIITFCLHILCMYVCMVGISNPDNIIQEYIYRSDSQHSYVACLSIIKISYVKINMSDPQNNQNLSANSDYIIVKPVRWARDTWLWRAWSNLSISSGAKPWRLACLSKAKRALSSWMTTTLSLLSKLLAKFCMLSKGWCVWFYTSWMSPWA